jgi:hypothetical protein
MFRKIENEKMEIYYKIDKINKVDGKEENVKK